MEAFDLNVLDKKKFTAEDYYIFCNWNSTVICSRKIHCSRLVFPKTVIWVCENKVCVKTFVELQYTHLAVKIIVFSKLHP